MKEVAFKPLSTPLSFSFSPGLLLITTLYDRSYVALAVVESAVDF